MASPSDSAFTPELIRLLAPGGVLRAGINLSNFLLVSARAPDGGPAGVAPDLARAIAAELGLPVALVPYASPALVADAAEQDSWDIALIGAEPQRANVIAFTPPYVGIEATYLVPPGSRIHDLGEVDRPGHRIAVTARTAYGLWLERNIAHAELVPAATMAEALARCRAEGLDALAGLRAGLVDDIRSWPGSRILEGRFMTVQQAVGVPRAKEAALGPLMALLSRLRERGVVGEFIARHGVRGLEPL